MAPVLTKYWHASNGDISASGVVNSCSKQRTFWCTCMLHTHTISAHALVANHSEGYPCHICEQRADSRLELLVRGSLRGLGVQFEVYPKVLAGKFGPADVWVRTENLIIQVDGPQHVDQHCKSVSNAVQRDRDAAFNAAAAGQGRCLLRLHHGDVEVGDAHRYIKQALWFCRHRPDLCFLMYSKRYLALGWAPMVVVCKHAP